MSLVKRKAKAKSKKDNVKIGANFQPSGARGQKSKHIGIQQKLAASHKRPQKNEEDEDLLQEENKEDDVV